MNDKIEKTKNVYRALKPIAVVTGKYVYDRRGRFSAAGTALALYPWLRRPHHTWAEFEKDFRMYDQFSRRRQQT